jgi:hypothetical protein
MILCPRRDRQFDRGDRASARHVATQDGPAHLGHRADVGGNLVQVVLIDDAVAVDVAQQPVEMVHRDLVVRSLYIHLVVAVGGRRAEILFAIILAILLAGTGTMGIQASADQRIVWLRISFQQYWLNALYRASSKKMPHAPPVAAWGS